MAKFQADPKDIATLMALADEFYAGGQFETSATWLDKVLAIEPEHIQGLLARGAVYFNLERPAPTPRRPGRRSSPSSPTTSRSTTTSASCT